MEAREAREARETQETKEAGWPASARLQLKPYQKECLEAAKSHNLLAVLPTNSGKTLVAASLAEHYTGTQPQPLRGKVVFLAPTVALVEQQAGVLADHLRAVRWDKVHDEEDSNSNSNPNPTSHSNSMLSRRLRWRMHHGKLTAKDSMEPCEEDSDSSGMQRGSDFWQSADVFVLTPFFLLSSLVHAQVRMRDLGLLVLDEAHHTQGRDQYSLIMRYFYRPCPASSRPRVLGLTASPFKGSAHSSPEELHKSLVELEELLDCTAWTSTACCPPPATAKFCPFQGDPSSSTSNSLLSISQEVLEGDAQAADAERARKLWRQLKDIVLGDDPTMQAMGAWAGVETLRLVCKENKRGWVLLDDDDEPLEKAGKQAGAAGAAWGVRCRSLLRRLDDWERVNGPQLLLDSSPSLQALLKLLRERDSPGLRALVFVQTRLRALLVHRFLQRDPSLRGDTAPVVSSNQRTSAMQPLRFGTTSRTQRSTLQSFRGDGQTGGGLRVLVATPVLEEGIDVPNCSLVVRFDPPKTPIENIQSRGRARHSESEYIHLMHKASSCHLKLLEDFARDEEALRSLLGTTTDNFQSRREARPQPPAESHDNVLEVPSTGALLPMEMALDFLRRIYVHHSADGGEGPNAIHFAEPHFSLKEKSHKASNFSCKQTNAGAWQFSVRLPHVGGCNVVLPKQLEVQGKELPKDQARQSAALEAIRELHRHGVLDDRLCVVGRGECLEKLKRAAGGLTQHVGSHRSDDNVAEGRMEDIILQLPPCLREPQNTSDPLFLHCVHGLPLEDSGPGLGLLLADSVGAPLPFVLRPQWGDAACTLASPGRVKLTEAELAEVAHWTACALELSNIHMMLAPWAVPHRSGRQVPRLKPREGDYTAGSPARAVNHTSRSERAWFAIVPLGHTGSIDWEFLRWGLGQMETAQFPLLLQEGLEQTARPSASADDPGEGGGHEHAQLEHFPGLPTSLELSQAVLLGPRRDDPRQHLYSWASVSQPPCLNLDGPILLDVEHVSRHMENAVSAHNHRDRDKETQQLPPQHCRCLPISLSQLLLLKLLPGVLWRVTHLAVVREVLEQEKGLDGAALQHVADALTHRAACAPGTERATLCHYEVLEFLGDAVLKCLACTWVFANFPDAAEGQLSKEAQKLQSNYFLRKCLLRHGWQRALLAKAFQPKRSLELLRTQRVSHKQQADVVEALLGASFLQGERKGVRSIGDQHSVDAAVGFFSRYLLPQLQLEGGACGCGCGSGSGSGSGWGEGPAMHLHPGSYRALLRPRSAIATGMAAAPASARTLTFGDYLEKPSLLLEETEIEFQRLEFLGDAALQLLVSQHLLQTFPDHSEGDLSELRSSLVCNEHLARKMLRRLSASCSAVGSAGSVGFCAFQKFFPPGMLEPVKAFAERLSHQSVGADFVVGRGLGLASSALSATVEGAVEVVEAPKCIADLYEAIVGAMLLHSDGSLGQVWHAISADFHIEPHEAESGLRRRREALMQIASIACCRPTVRPDPERKEEARRRWSEKVGRQQLEVERRRVQEASEAKRQGAAGAALEAHLQRDPIFAGVDVGKWLQAPRSLPPGTPTVSPVAALAANRPAAAVDPRPKCDSAPGASAAASASNSASASPPASAQTVSEVATLPGQPSGIFVGVLQHERSGNQVTATLSMRLSAGAEETRLSSSGADSGPDLERVYTEIRRAVFSQLGLPDVPPQVEQGGIQGVLRTVLARAGPAGKGLADFGNDPAVSEARRAFDVPKTRKLKDLLQQWPHVFELCGEGAGATVRLRQQA